MAVLPLLRSASLPWRQTHVFWCDERDVPPSDSTSNNGQATRLWAGSPLAASAQLHPMTDGRTPLAEAATAYDGLLRRIVGEALVLDLVLLGVGPDGHVASLFPGHAALEEGVRAVVPVADSPKPPPRRLTLTLPLLMGARETIVVALGPEKAPVMRRVLMAGAASLPVSRVIQGAVAPTVLLDDAAAADLPSGMGTPIS